MLDNEFMNTLEKQKVFLRYALSNQSFTEQLQSICKTNSYQIFYVPLRNSFHHKDNVVSSYIIQLLAETAFVQTKS